MKIVGHLQNNWDIDLDYGNAGESVILSILNGAKKIEVKTDRMAHKTGNIAVEFRYKGNPSGISKTEAHYWAFVLFDGGLIYFIETNRLKEIARICYMNNGFVKGGDNNMSDIILIPIKNLIQQI